MKGAYLYIVIFLTSYVCYGQTDQVEGCYIWTSDYYIGDFQKICFNRDSTFYYQRHQNDVLPDDYSIGVWEIKSDIIKLKSIEPFTSDTQIVQNGNPLNDTIFIKTVDIHSGVSLPYRTIEIYDLSMNKMSSQFTDSLGIVKIKFEKDFKYLRCRQYACYVPILLNLNSLTNDHITIKTACDEDAMIFKNMTDKRYIIKSSKKLIEVYQNGKFINYYRQK